MDCTQYTSKISRGRWGRLFSSTQYHRSPLKAITNLHNLFCRIYAKEYRLGRNTLPQHGGSSQPCCSRSARHCFRAACPSSLAK